MVIVKNKKAIVKISSITIAIVALFLFTFFIANVWAESNGPSISTDKEDYSPDEIVLVSGSGFTPNTELTFSVTDPNGGVDVCDSISCSSLKFLDGFISSDSDGAFSDYQYKINGIEGEYNLVVSDGEKSASVVFTDSPPIFYIKILEPEDLSSAVGLVDVSGEWEVQNAVGQLNQYNVEIDWGDGNKQTINIIRNEEGSGNDKRYWGTFNTYTNFTHNYTSCGDFNITVKLYHGQPPGNEAGDAQDKITIHSCDNEPEPTCNYTCFTPNTLGVEGKTSIGISGEKTLQAILDDAGYIIDVENDQSNIQVWETTSIVELEVLYIERIAALGHVFGYYNKGNLSSFVPLFATGNVSGYNMTIASEGDKFTFVIPAGKEIGFAIKMNSGTYATERSLNSGSENRALVYDLCNEFVIAFEDKDDWDFNDVVVSINALNCYDDICDLDKVGPVVSNLTAIKTTDVCAVRIMANVDDECSNVATAEYFLGGQTCGPAGTGDLLNPLDGSFDSLSERVFKNNVIVQDGQINVHVRGKDAKGNWGTCKTISVSMDCLPPNYPTCALGNKNPEHSGIRGIIIDDVCNAQELLVCGENPVLRANVCDKESRIQLAEYFLNDMPLINWFGIPMNVSDGYWDETCEDVEAVIDISDLEDGTHYVQLHGKDGQENWGKFQNNPIVSFIKDTTAPQVYKEIVFANGSYVQCNYGSAMGKDLTDGCYYVLPGTEVTLSAEDPDPQGTNEFAGDVVINYNVYFSEECTTENPEWTLKESGQSEIDGNVTINLDDDSCHLVEYWAVDQCGNAGEKHYELDIVDSKSPVTTKEIIGDKISGWGVIDYFINSQTEINLKCSDRNPHPVGGEKLYWEVYYNGTSNDCNLSEEEWGEAIMSGSSNGEDSIKGLKDSCHKIVYWCEDALGNVEEKQIEIDAVDNSAPVISREIVGPWFGDCSEDREDYCFIDGVTQIVVNATEIGYHPVGSVDCDWSYTLLDGEASGGEESVGSNFVVQFPEESMHELTLVCKDALGNEATHVEVFVVDKTAPLTTKEYGEPIVEVEGVKWITNMTSITLDAVDGEPHPSGVNKTYYRFGLVNDAYCWGTNENEFAGLNNDWNVYSESFVIPQDSCHAIEYFSVDNVNKTEEVNVQFVFVDNQAPATNKFVGLPRYPCLDNKCGGESIWDAWYVTSQTNITLSCADKNPHPVGQEKLCYRIEGPGYNNVLNCVELDESKNYTFNYVEDSLHKLEWYCEDGLDNKGEMQVEWDNVDNKAPYIAFVNPTPKFAENVDMCVQGIVVMIVDEKSGVYDSSVHAVLINSSGDVVRNVSLSKVNYAGSVTYEGMMNKELPEEYYELVVYASDNLGNSAMVSRTEYLSETINVQFINPANCYIDAETGGSCNFTFNVCMRGGNSIKFWMNKFAGVATPNMLNAKISNNGNQAIVGLMEVLEGVSEDECKANAEIWPSNWEWDEDNEECLFRTAAEELPLACEEINAKTKFNLHLNVSKEIAGEIGSGNYKLDYFIKSFMNEESPLCPEVENGNGGNEEDNGNGYDNEEESYCVDINTASLSELQLLSGIGPVKAQDIINNRPFYSIDELINVPGIGQTTLNNIKSQGLVCEIEQIAY